MKRKKRVVRASKKAKPSVKEGLAPRAYMRNLVTKQPRITSKGPGTVSIKHVELFALQKVVTNTLDNFEFRCNPGLASMFPWLSTIAARYESFKFESLLFRFIPRQPPTVAGAIGCYFDFDVEDPRANTMIEVGMQHTNKSTNVWNTLETKVDAKESPNLWHYTRGGAIADNHETKMYDLGKLICYHDMITLAAGTVLGYWEVDYSITLKTPQYEDPVSGKWTSVTTLQSDIFTGGINAVGHSLRPFTVSGPTTVTFDEPYQGLMSIKVDGADIDRVPTATWAGTAGGMITSLYSCYLANNKGVNEIAIKVLRGDTITFTSLTAGISGFTICLAKAAYDSLVAS